MVGGVDVGRVLDWRHAGERGLGAAGRLRSAAAMTTRIGLVVITGNTMVT